MIEVEPLQGDHEVVQGDGMGGKHRANRLLPWCHAYQLDCWTTA
jgi:hypothetical protein